MRRAVAALPLLAACAACSSQSTDEYDRGRSGGAQTFGTGVRHAYPEAPYGASIGATIENLRFLGWSDPVASSHDTTNFERVELAKFYSGPGSNNDTKLLVITSTAIWCTACKAEYLDMAEYVPQYRAKGVEFVGALFEDNDSNPAKPPDLATWAQTYDVTFPFVLDPALKFGIFFDREATPMEMIVDASTMQILSIETGWARGNGPGTLWAELDLFLGG
jgi:hypothetical protein